MHGHSNIKQLKVREDKGQNNKWCGNVLRLRKIQFAYLVGAKHEGSKTTPENPTVIYSPSSVNFLNLSTH